MNCNFGNVTKLPDKHANDSHVQQIYMGCDTENSWTMSRALMVDSNENEQLTNGRNHRILSPQLSLSHTGHLH